MQTLPALEQCDGITEKDIADFKSEYDPKKLSTLKKALELVLCAKTEEDALKVLNVFVNTENLY